MGKVKKVHTKLEALAKLQKYCVYQERCHHEVRSKLLQLGIWGEDLEQIMAQLIEDNFLNETRFAVAFVRGKFNQKHWGRRKIIQALKWKDVNPYDIQRGLKEIDEKSYYDTLKNLLSRKSKGYPSLDSSLLKNKLYRFALQKGYEPEIILKSLQTII
jgi:regulatory protein